MCVVCFRTVSASRIAPEGQQLLSTSTSIKPHLQDSPSTDPTDSSTDPQKKKKKKGSIDFEDQDPDVRSHWALLVAGSSGWYNYRHQADVFHAYQVLLAGGYRKDHIVVMAADDIAQDSENPMPGKVFNMPGKPMCRRCRRTAAVHVRRLPLVAHSCMLHLPETSMRVSVVALAGCLTFINADCHMVLTRSLATPPHPHPPTL